MLGIALQVAEQAGMPLMCHIDHPPPSYEDVVEQLRPGDILTHAFRPFPNSPVSAQGTVRQAVLDTRKLGLTNAQMRKIRGDDIAMVFQEPMTASTPC